MIRPAHDHDFVPTIRPNRLANRATPAAPTNATRSASPIRSRQHTEEAMAMGQRSSVKRRRHGQLSTGAVLLSVLSSSSAAMAACISLQGSTTCPAFQAGSVSTDDTLVGLYRFLQFVSDRESFDSELENYVQKGYVQEKYGNLLGCADVPTTNTSDYYARFTTTVICNAIVQNSINACQLSAEQSRPVCAETCAEYAESEAYVVADGSLCTNASSAASTQIRADFTDCALPADSLSSGSCIEGITNEPTNCGYGNSTIGLCSYCASGGINSTDTCCYSANAQNRCAGVVLPSIATTMTFTTGVPAATSSSTSSPASSGSSLPVSTSGLSKGAIAGIVIGSVIGVGLLAALLFMALLILRRRRGSQDGSIFNQPSPARKGPAPSTAQSGQVAPPGYEILPGGRIARMSALEGHSGDSPDRQAGRDLAGGAAAGAAAGYAMGRRRADDNSSSDGFGDSPGSERGVAGVLRPPPTTTRRNGSLSSNSVLAGEDPQSPGSAGMSSPQGMASQQSEQLPFFKDYYSQDDIHPGNRVSVLWAYQPRANDEFALERGDMLKVVGIWDDGWATGIMADERAEEWEARRQAQRDSGVSHTSGRGRDESPPVSGEIKAFPLVCVCLPEHWRKTIEEGSTEAGSSINPHTTTTGS